MYQTSGSLCPRLQPVPWHVTSICSLFSWINHLSEMWELASLVICRNNCCPFVWCVAAVNSPVSLCYFRWDSKQLQLWSSSSWPCCACRGCSTALLLWLLTATAPCLAGSTCAFTRGTAGVAETCPTTLPLPVSSPRHCSRL